MASREKILHQGKHPFDAYPFEALLFGSWKSTELIKIASGKMTLHFVDKDELTIKKGYSDMRIRSRNATVSDCTSFLHQGIDVCVLSTFQSDDSDRLNSDPVWADAKICSVDRKPHKPDCSCEYYVKFYANQGSLGSREKTLSKDVKVVGLNQISILQKLGCKSHEDQPYRWGSSEDCIARSETRLFFSSYFVCNMSWLVVTSLLKNVSFCVRSVENEIFYQILETSTRSSDNSHIKAVNFRLEDGMPLVFDVGFSDTKSIVPAEHDSQQVPPSIEELRRSTRRSREPERYLGYDLCSGSVRTRLRKMHSGKDDEKLALVVYSTPQGDAEGGKNVVINNKEVSLGDAIPREHAKLLSVFLAPKGGTADAPMCNILHAKVTGRNTHHQSGETSEPCNQPGGDAKLADEVSSGRYYNLKSCKKNQRKDLSDMMDLEPRWEGLNSRSGANRKRRRSGYSRNMNDEDEERAWNRRALDATASKKIIDSYLESMVKLPTKEEAPINEQWKEAINFRQGKKAEKTQTEEEGISETEMLWGEMEEAMKERYLEEQAEGSNVAASAHTEEESIITCKHDYRLDEQIGVYCHRCGSVKTEIRYVMPSFWEPPSRKHKERQWNGEEPEPIADDGDVDLHMFPTPAACDEPISNETKTVWALIPELREKMHLHQKKAFEFLWQNIAGSIDRALMEAQSEGRGGCVICHAPGAGKTLLTIAFLVSYLKLFPQKKPLILAPKTTLHTWCTEFTKWEIAVPVHLIHSRSGRRYFSKKGLPNSSEEVKHALHCLHKIQMWLAEPSVLVMGYTSFLSLTNEDSEFEYQKSMAKALRKIPGILILDEGHNPRSTGARLRKGLMSVETELRILLSGTLFQNNFGEYFNTLCLARPRFIHEVLSKLDPEYVRREAEKKAPHVVEARARKFFLDFIGVKIDSGNIGVQETREGINMLNNFTSGFIDVYDSESADSRLPGLQIYTLLMNNTEKQSEILQKLQEKMNQSSQYPLEVEFLIALVSIHPSLITRTKCAEKFFSSDQLKQLEKSKFDLKIGPKVKFLLKLVFRVIKKEEKVLIFCHNLAPMWLLSELFQKFFNWKEGKEILTLHGNLDLFERGEVINKFQDRDGASKVLLASITACAEGISLTAASRVVFLDSEWNPSKTKQAIARAFRPGQDKVVYVYQLLAAESFEEDKYKKINWKDWVSRMIFSKDSVEGPSSWQAEKIEDDVLREFAEEDKSKSKSIHQILKNEKASTN